MIELRSLHDGMRSYAVAVWRNGFGIASAISGGIALANDFVLGPWGWPYLALTRVAAITCFVVTFALALFKAYEEMRQRALAAEAQLARPKPLADAVRRIMRELVAARPMIINRESAEQWLRAVQDLPIKLLSGPIEERRITRWYAPYSSISDVLADPRWPGIVDDVCEQFSLLEQSLRDEQVPPNAPVARFRSFHPGVFGSIAPAPAVAQDAASSGKQRKVAA